MEVADTRPLSNFGSSATDQRLLEIPTCYLQIAVLTARYNENVQNDSTCNPGACYLQIAVLTARYNENVQNDLSTSSYLQLLAPTCSVVFSFAFMR
jgi:hypothetical protein